MPKRHVPGPWAASLAALLLIAAVSVPLLRPSGRDGAATGVRAGQVAADADPSPGDPGEPSPGSPSEPASGSPSGSPSWAAPSAPPPAASASSGAAPAPAGEAGGGACTIAAAGDIAEEGGNQEATAQLVESLRPTAVLTLGDNAYDNGSASDYQKYYDPSWGRFKQITRPAPGNHEYQTEGATGYLEYFGVKPYYSYDLCGWHLYSLNRELTGAERDQELAWLRSDLAAHRGRPMLAVWHEPRWTSGTKHGSDDGAADLWQAVVDGGVRVVLSGHEHAYERFAEMDGAGRRSPGGTREFVVGEGGNDNISGFGDPLPASEVRLSGPHGVLSMTLRPDGYDWRLVQVGGKVADRGSQQLSGAAAASPASGTAVPPAAPAPQAPAPQNPAPQNPAPQAPAPQAPAPQNPAPQVPAPQAPAASPPAAAPVAPAASYWWVPASQASYVKGTEPGTSFARSPELLADAADPARHIAFLTFDLSTGLPAAATGLSGRLYLRATTDLPTGVDVYWAPSTWSQDTLTWNHQPPVGSAPVARIGPARAGDWVNVDVGPLLRLGGPVSFALTGSAPGRADARFAAEDTATPPMLFLGVTPVPPR